MGRLSIKAKLILALSVILVAAFLVTNIVNYRVSKASIRKSIIESSLPLTRDNIYSEIQADLLRPVFVSSLMANDTFLKDWALAGETDVDKVTRYLKEIKEKYGFFTAFFVSDLTGKYYYADGILKTVSPEDDHDVWFYDFKKLNRDYDLVVDTNEAADNTLTIFINHRLKDYKGNLLGVTGVGLNLQTVANLLASYQKRYDRNIYLVDGNGLVKVHKDDGYVDRVNIFHEEGISAIASRVLKVGTESGFFDYTAGGRHILLTSRFIPEFNWYLLVEQDESAALKGITGNFIRNLLFGALVILVILGINIFTVNRFQGELERMATTDKLTGASNRREFDRGFEQAAYLFRRQQTSFSVILFDIDSFKRVNDELGHLAGDRIIKEVVAITDACIRKNDMLVRWGGDEFIILTQSDLEHALTVAQRISEAILQADFFHEGGQGSRRAISVSCGVAQFAGEETMDSLVMRADAALYLAKARGRNRIISERDLANAELTG